MELFQQNLFPLKYLFLIYDPNANINSPWSCSFYHMLEGWLAQFYNAQLSRVPKAPSYTVFDCRTQSHSVSQMAESVQVRFYFTFI